MPPAAFAEHLEFLRQRYELIPLERLRPVDGRNDWGELPDNSLAITFDDGWRSNYDLLPVIREHQAPVTIFLNAGLVGANRKLWNYTLTLADRKGPLGRGLEAIPNRDRNERLRQFNDHFPEKEYPERDMLSHDEIEEMKEAVDFQSHGMFHPVMTNCDDEELDFEMGQAKTMLSELTGTDCWAVAYPYGRCSDSVAAAARRAGYSLGRTANDPGLNDPDEDPLHLRAIGVFEWADVAELADSIAWGELKTLLGR